MSEEMETGRPSEEARSLVNILSGPIVSKEELTNRLSDAISSGDLRPGDRLLTEREIATLSSLSRSTVRDALASLERAGRIVRRVGRGTFIARHAPAIRNEHQRTPSPTEFLAFRASVEPALADVLVMTADDETLDAIQAFVLRGRNARTWEDTEFYDREFHHHLYVATKNVLFIQIAQIVGDIRAQPSWRRLKERSFSAERWDIYQAEHETIIEALRARDAKRAREMLHHHLLGVRSRFIA